MTWLIDRLYPQLRSLPETERNAALRRARSAPFDVLELVGMAAGLVVVTAMTRFGMATLEPEAHLARALAAFFVALPLLTVAVGPFLVRRTRRSLDEQVSERR
jgi:hypothetical protein